MVHSAHRPSKDELYPWLTLLRAPGIGPVGTARLLKHISHPDELLSLPRSTLAELGLKKATLSWFSRPDHALINQDLAWLAQSSTHHIITLDNPGYPALLREIHDSPPVLFVQGQLERLAQPQIAMVGSRNPSAGGRDNARHFAAGLSRSGLTVTSGLALGIDAAAHEGALEVGGATLAVTGCGPDRVYPARHRLLAQRITESGAIISELPTGAPPRPEHFPRRNRIISGMSLGTLVVEAAPKSGSLITARQAADQGREVFAIPGSIHNPLARGCHLLIRLGAKLVETLQDITDELAALAELHAQHQVNTLPTPDIPDGKTGQILEALAFDPVSVDTLVTRSRLTIDEVSSILLLLELDGLVTILPGGLYARTSHQ